MWERKALGDHTPLNLQLTIWFLICLHMGMRGRDEHHKYRYGDFRICATVEGKEYVEFLQERGTKTRLGESEQYQIRAFTPKMWETLEQPERCPVRLFKKFVSHRPEKMKQPDSPFYLSINYNHTSSSSWYKNQPMGVNTINSAMKILAQQADLPGKKTNHSARKTTVETLCSSGITDSTVMQVSGHRNVQSLNSYKKPSMEQQETISHILSRYNKVGSTSTDQTLEIQQKRQISSTSYTNHTVGGAIMPSATFNGCTINFTCSCQGSHQSR